MANILLPKLKGKLYTTLEQIQHGHPVFRAYCKNSFLKQYEKLSTFLRNELCSNNLTEFGLKKGLDHLAAVRAKFLEITDRCAGFQTQCLNGHVDFPLLQKLALPLTRGKVQFPGIKIHNPRMIRLLEVFLHGSTQVAGWRTPQLREAVLQAYRLSPKTYTLNQLRYDLRKLKGHGLLQRDGRRYAYRLTPAGTKVALIFLLFHQRLCGPLANSLFHHRPHPSRQPKTKLELAYHKADASIQRVIQLLQAA